MKRNVISVIKFDNYSIIIYEDTSVDLVKSFTKSIEHKIKGN